jgi:hypothetical protein
MAIHLKRLIHRLSMGSGRPMGLMMVKTVFTEGGLIIPRKIALGALVALVIGAVAQVASYVEAKTTTAAEIMALQKADVESRARGDDVRRRLAELESMRVAVARIEERQRSQDELLRQFIAETREVLRRR